MKTKVTLVKVRFNNNKKSLTRSVKSQKGICGNHLCADCFGEGQDMTAQIIDVTEIRQPKKKDDKLSKVSES